MLRDMAGNIVGTASLGEDVTERKRTKLAAGTGEARIREQAKLLDLAQDAIIVRDMEDRVEFWNHGAENLYGWTAAEVHGGEASGFFTKMNLTVRCGMNNNYRERHMDRGMPAQLQERRHGHGAQSLDPGPG